MKLFVKKIIYRFFKLISKTKIGRFIENTIIEQAMGNTLTVQHNGLDLTFACPNALTRWRAETFSEKEPETLAWINGMSADDVLWDVGANVGLYSIYAAKRHQMKVFSFEPSVFNLELLGRNCAANDVTNNITIISMALSDKTSINKMQHTDTTWGGALSSFGAEFGADGESFINNIEYSILGISGDDILAKNLIVAPTHIKIDVDGIEHLILSGAVKTLKQVKSILVEVNDNFLEQANNVTKILTDAGFKLADKQMSSFTSPQDSIKNQIWVR